MPSLIRFCGNNFSNRVLFPVSGPVRGEWLRPGGLNSAVGALSVTWQLDRQTTGGWSNFNTLSGSVQFNYNSPNLYNANYRLTISLTDPVGLMTPQTLVAQWSDLGRSNRIGSMNINGVVTIDEAGVAKPVRLYDRSTGILVATATSASNGTFSFGSIDNSNGNYIVLAVDNSNTYNIVGADNINAI